MVARTHVVKIRHLE